MLFLHDGFAIKHCRTQCPPFAAFSAVNVGLEMALLVLIDNTAFLAECLDMLHFYTILPLQPGPTLRSSTGRRTMQNRSPQVAETTQLQRAFAEDSLAISTPVNYFPGPARKALLNCLGAAKNSADIMDAMESVREKSGSLECMIDITVVGNSYGRF
jgi:hypothetical protein